MLLVGWLTLAAPVRAQEAESIKSFDVAIDVRADGSIQVTERIDYFFPDSRHGIFREFPLEYENDAGERYRIPLQIISVRRADGQPWNYQQETGSSGLRLRVGDPDRFVTGRQTYVISYVASGALRYYQDHDELFWNVTGTGWTVPIESATASVTLPAAIPTEGLKARCFTGAYGSKDQDCRFETSGRTAAFAAAAPLTVVVGWAPGVVAKMSPQAALPFGLNFGLAAMWPLLLPLAALAVLLYLWSRHGRDPRGRSVLVVQYDPPKGLSASEVGALYDEDASVKDVIAGLVDLAVRGYVKITETESKVLFFTNKDFRLESLKDFRNDKSLKLYESRLLDVLFLKGNTVTLSELKSRYAFKDDLAKIQNGIFDQLVAFGYFAANPQKVRAKYVGFGSALIFAAVFVPSLGNFYISAAFVLTAILCFVFGWLMPRRSELGVAAKEHAVGFREYLDKAEQHRLEWQVSEGVFEKFLPYAMAFGIADRWAKAFEGLAIQPPQWYSGSAFHAGAFHAAAFNGMFNSFNSAMNSAVMSRPSKSHSGSGFSGGFSGGGGGGGGGGSW